MGIETPAKRPPKGELQGRAVTNVTRISKSNRVFGGHLRTNSNGPNFHFLFGVLVQNLGKRSQVCRHRSAHSRSPLAISPLVLTQRSRLQTNKSEELLFL